jgi:hypothetical protein
MAPAHDTAVVRVLGEFRQGRLDSSSEQSVRLAHLPEAGALSPVGGKFVNEILKAANRPSRLLYAGVKPRPSVRGMQQRGLDDTPRHRHSVRDAGSIHPAGRLIGRV